MSNSNYVIDKKRNPFFTIIKIIVIVIILVLMVGLNNSVDTKNLLVLISHKLYQII